MLGNIDICEIKQGKNIKWAIPRFFQTSNDFQKFTRSVTLFRKTWMLVVYPRDIDGKSPEYVIIGAILMDPDPDSEFSVDLELNVEWIRLQYCSQDMSSGEDPFKMWAWRCKSIRLQTLLHDDVLQGWMMISSKEENSNSTFIKDVACQTTFVSSDAYFSRDFQDFFQNGKKSDVSIEVQGQLFKVHKLILEACSPVFSDMLDQHMSDKNTHILKVDDCDPETFQNFLKCLYLGKLENTELNKLMNLYKLSDRFGVYELRRKISECIVKELSVDAVSDVFMLASLYKDAELMVSLDNFMTKGIEILLLEEP